MSQENSAVNESAPAPAAATTDASSVSASPLLSTRLGDPFYKFPLPNEVEQDCIAFLKKNLKEQPLEDDTQFLTANTFLRFSRARECNHEKSLAMLEACIKWRREYKPHHVTYDDCRGVLSLGTSFMLGHCREGRPIFYICPGPKNPYPAEERVKVMIYLMEETMKLGHHSLTWVFDWSRSGERGKDAESKKLREQTTKYLQDYYPERLGAMYMVDTPWYFWPLWAVVSLFLQKKTKNKIHIIKNKDLVKYIEPQFLLKQFQGGEAATPVVRLPDETVATMEDRTAPCASSDECAPPATATAGEAEQ